VTKSSSILLVLLDNKYNFRLLGEGWTLLNTHSPSRPLCIWRNKKRNWDRIRSSCTKTVNKYAYFCKPPYSLESSRLPTYMFYSGAWKICQTKKSSLELFYDKVGWRWGQGICWRGEMVVMAKRVLKTVKLWCEQNRAGVRVLYGFNISNPQPNQPEKIHYN